MKSLERFNLIVRGHGKLSATDKIVLLVLANHANDAGKLFIAQATLAAESCLTARAVSKAIARLLLNGHIQVARGNRRQGHANEYTLHPRLAPQPKEPHHANDVHVNENHVNDVHVNETYGLEERRSGLGERRSSHQVNDVPPKCLKRSDPTKGSKKGERAERDDERVWRIFRSQYQRIRGAKYVATAQDGAAAKAIATSARQHGDFDLESLVGFWVVSFLGNDDDDWIAERGWPLHALARALTSIGLPRDREPEVDPEPKRGPVVPPPAEALEAIRKLGAKHELLPDVGENAWKDVPPIPTGTGEP